MIFLIVFLKVCASSSVLATASTALKCQEVSLCFNASITFIKSLLVTNGKAPVSVAIAYLNFNDGGNANAVGRISASETSFAVVLLSLISFLYPSIFAPSPAKTAALYTFLLSAIGDKINTPLLTNPFAIPLHSFS